jgi:hypothetical protein
MDLYAIEKAAKLLGEYLTENRATGIVAIGTRSRSREIVVYTARARVSKLVPSTWWGFSVRVVKHGPVHPLTAG